MDRDIHVLWHVKVELHLEQDNIQDVRDIRKDVGSGNKNEVVVYDKNLIIYQRERYSAGYRG
jgi:hypothetical protein